MTLWEHLEDLRWVLFKSAVALVVTTGVSLTYIRQMLGLLLLPVRRLGKAVELIFTAPMDAFMVQFKMALLLGFVLALPFMLYFVWGFLAPGLKANERRWVQRVLGAGVGFFLVGAAFGYGLLFLTLPVLASFGFGDVRQMWSFRDYVDFCFQLIIGTGLVFEFPLVLLSLVRIGILSVTTLRKMRPYAIVVIFIVAAVVTPSTDIVTQCVLALPLLVLYEMTIFLARLKRTPAPVVESDGE